MEGGLLASKHKALTVAVDGKGSQHREGIEVYGRRLSRVHGYILLIYTQVTLAGPCYLFLADKITYKQM